jgi:predicted Rossmann fold nucleotide-binding protein DprA/Smf involved in DNA uptake
MPLLKIVQSKVQLISWRDQVEEIIERLAKSEKISLEQIQAILLEGEKSGFVNKDKTGYTRNGDLSLLSNFYGLDELIQAY